MNNNLAKIILRSLAVFLVLWILHALLQTLFIPDKNFISCFLTGTGVADLIFRGCLLIVIFLAFFAWMRHKKEPLDPDLLLPEEILHKDEVENRALKEFVHALRTHLNSIVGFVHLLHEKDLDGKTAETYISYLKESKHEISGDIDALIDSYEKSIKKSKSKQWDYLERFNWSGKKILIAEDNILNFKLLKNILDKTGVEIIWAKNGQEAVQQVEKHPDVRLVLMDIIMPVMDGFEATLAIQKTHPDIPVIAQSAHGFENEERTLEQYGFTGYITKPIWHYELVLKASRYLDK